MTCTTFPGGGPLNSGAVINGNKTLQVKYVAGRIGQTYAARGLSAFPRGFWTSDYYAPFGQAANANAGVTDYYLFNPNATPLTINWQSQTTSGSFAIPGNSSQSYNRAIGANPSVPPAPASTSAPPVRSGASASATPPAKARRPARPSNGASACCRRRSSTKSTSWDGRPARCR